ncbi:MAG: hypothetical protein KatS3mg038_2776 [Candidatus Kapaibacterium sp.]|nr:MAG: hypothetical protein KatS3mg038_2776 [Candidatus Kapabacteria bacterium]
MMMVVNFAFARVRESNFECAGVVVWYVQVTDNKAPHRTRSRKADVRRCGWRK